MPDDLTTEELDRIEHIAKNIIASVKSNGALSPERQSDYVSAYAMFERCATPKTIVRLIAMARRALPSTQQSEDKT